MMKKLLILLFACSVAAYPLCARAEIAGSSERPMTENQGAKTEDRFKKYFEQVIERKNKSMEQRYNRLVKENRAGYIYGTTKLPRGKKRFTGPVSIWSRPYINDAHNKMIIQLPHETEVAVLRTKYTRSKSPHNPPPEANIRQVTIKQKWYEIAYLQKGDYYNIIKGWVLSDYLKIKPKTAGTK